jgi:hypothetical protein
MNKNQSKNRLACEVYWIGSGQNLQFSYFPLQFSEEETLDYTSTINRSYQIKSISRISFGSGFIPNKSASKRFLIRCKKHLEHFWLHPYFPTQGFLVFYELSHLYCCLLRRKDVEEHRQKTFIFIRKIRTLDCAVSLNKCSACIFDQYLLGLRRMTVCSCCDSWAKIKNAYPSKGHCT